MKYLKIILIIQILVTSCTNVLDREPLDIISDAVVWDDEVLVDAYINDIYSRMIFQYNDQAQSPGGRNYSYLINIVSDQATNARNWSGTVNQWAAGLLDETGGWENWHYDNIRRTNEFFDRIEGSTLADEIKNGFIGRVKLARALFYFTMVKWYGGLPIIDEAQSIDQSIEELQVPRNTEKEVYDFIIAECDDIIQENLLPEEAERVGDPSVYVAHALKSRAALYAASIARWGTVQNNGINGIPANSEMTYWQICYDASKAIMDGPFSLYNEVSGDLAENYRMMSLDESNSEIIWAKYYDGVEVSNDWSADNGLIGTAPSWMTENICPFLEFIEDFETVDGTIEPWDRDEISNGLWTYDELFGDLEPRFHAMIYTQGSNWSGFDNIQYYNGIRKEDGTIVRSGIVNGISAVGSNYRTSGRSFSGFAIKKGVDPSVSTQSSIGDVQKIQFRLGEILLNFAEAAFYLDRNEESLDAINQIRARVGLPAHTEVDEDKIRHERKIELAFEAHRHWDLKRWRIAVDAINKSWTGVNYVYDYSSGKFLVEFLEDFRTTGFAEKHYYFPITPGRIANNPALAPENPGY